MRAALVFAALALATPALAQEGTGSVDVQTLNGVRVWRPKPRPAPLARPATPPSTTVVVINNPPPVAPVGNEVIGLPVGLPFFHHRPHHRPFFPHGRPFFPDHGFGPPHAPPAVGVYQLHPGRRF